VAPVSKQDLNPVDYAFWESCSSDRVYNERNLVEAGHMLLYIVYKLYVHLMYR